MKPYEIISEDFKLGSDSKSIRCDYEINPVKITIKFKSNIYHKYKFNTGHAVNSLYDLKFDPSVSGLYIIYNKIYGIYKMSLKLNKTSLDNIFNFHINFVCPTYYGKSIKYVRINNVDYNIPIINVYFKQTILNNIIILDISKISICTIINHSNNTNTNVLLAFYFHGGAKKILENVNHLLYDELTIET